MQTAIGGFPWRWRKLEKFGKFERGIKDFSFSFDCQFHHVVHEVSS